MSSKFIVIFLMLACIFGCSKKVKEPNPGDYKVVIQYDNWNQMKADAGIKDQNMFLMLHASWCSICNTFKNDVLTEEEVGTILNNKIVIGLIDGDKDYGKPYMTQFNAGGFPTFLILDKNGNELAKKSGAFSKPDFLSWINPYLK